MMELELGLALPDRPGPKKAAASRSLGVLLDGKASSVDGAGNKRRATLPLFVRGGGDERRGGDDDDDDREVTNNNRRKRLVGWPPVKRAHIRRGGGGGGGAGYVKVKMEGVAIGRKVDVSLHGSYDELLRTLDRMFPPSTAAAAGVDDVVLVDQRRRRRHTYDVVTYEDAEGDWLLVGDVPWEAFAKSVKRLKILA